MTKLLLGGVKGPIQGIKNYTAEVGENFYIPTKEKAKVMSEFFTLV